MMNTEAPKEQTAQNSFEDLTLSDLLVKLLDAGYSFEQLKQMTMTQIYRVVKALEIEESSMSQAA